MAHKPIYSAPTAGGLALTDKLILLEPIALWIHQRGEKRTGVSRSELETKLAEGFGGQLGFSEAPARRRAKAFVDLLERRAMPLAQRDRDTYAFVHLNFQVSLAARALADRTDLVEEMLKHLHDPWWREVHLQAVAHLSSPCTRRSQTATQKLLTAIRNAGSWLEGELHRDLLFAFDALCEVGLWGVETPFRQELTQKVFGLWFKTEVKPLQGHIEERFSYAGTTPVCSHLVELLLPLAESWTPAVRSRVAHALGRLGSAAATPAALAKLLELSQDGNSDVCSRAIVALGGLGSAAATPNVLERLLELIQDGDDGGTGAAIALGCLGSAAATPQVLARLMELIQDGNYGVRSCAASALGALGRAAATPVVVARLMELIQDGEASVSLSAAKVLSRLGSAANIAEVLARLVELSNDTNEDVRYEVTGFLGSLGDAAATPPVLARLVELTHDEDPDVRSSAGDALGSLGSAAATPAVLTRLLEVSQDGNSAMRSTAAAALGALGNPAATAAVLARLVELIQDGDNDVRSYAAVALGALGSAAATPPVIARLLGLIQHGHTSVRCLSAVALGQMLETLKPEQLEPLETWCRANLSNEEYELIGGELRSVSSSAFEVLQRLAAWQTCFTQTSSATAPSCPAPID